MAKHRLNYGLDIIDRLSSLGKILNYYCEKEYQVNKENDSAVDIAWLFEAEQKYPLFIFEVESKTTNSIPANPLKVFGETNQKFEKPLFLFHLLLTGGQNSGKIQQLERTYGTYNYRIYRFSLEEEINLIKDILSQHRRLTNKLAISKFIIEIFKNWKEVDINSVILHMEGLEFEKDSGMTLPAYAFLFRKIPVLKDHFLRRLKQKAETPDCLVEVESYGTWLGTQWATPIHLGLLSAFANDGQEEKYFSKFKHWQKRTPRTKQIEARYGLSRDYDLFILGMCGAVLSLTAILFYKVQAAKEYFINELLEIVKKSERLDMDANIYNCIWLLHLSAGLKTGKKYFEYARRLINKNGGIPDLFFLAPPINFIRVLEGDETLESFGNRILIPAWEEFRLVKQQRKPKPEILFELAINYLTDNEDNWNPIIAGQM